MESQNLIELVHQMLDLLTKIEENTRPEKVEETKSKITGFAAGGDKK